MYKRPIAKEDYQRLYNIQVLLNIYSQGVNKLSADKFLKLKYKMSIYDHKELFIQEPFYSIQIGPFQLDWTHETIISILKTKNYEWFSFQIGIRTNANFYATKITSR